jgi:K+-transporting ATPase ATPase B chain
MADHMEEDGKRLTAPEPLAAPAAKFERAPSLFDGVIVQRALRDAFAKLNPGTLWKTPVIFVAEAGAVLVTVLLLLHAATGATGLRFEIQVAVWLWVTVLFANFAEAMAEARGKAHADTLRKTRTDSIAKRILQKGRVETIPASKLRAGDLVVAETGDLIPGDGEVIDGIATVDESVITGESAPVIRESGGDRSAVTGGTRILSDYVKVRITSNAGETFLDKMIALVEGAERQKTPNEVALTILVSGLTLMLLLVVATLPPFAIYGVKQTGGGLIPSVTMLVSLLVCLIPTTIGGLLSTIGIAGMNRVMQHNVLAMSGKAVEAAGDIHTLLLDKTGTVTLGSREAVELIAFPGVAESELAYAAQLSSLADETPEGRSVVVLTKEKYQLRARAVSEHEAQFIPFSAFTRMSGVNIDGRMLRKGASGAIANFVKEAGGTLPVTFDEVSERIARRGGTPLAVADGPRALGVIYLKDIVKDGMAQRVAQLRAMGIRPVMITGDNPMTASAIAAEAGMDEFLAQATPADKLAYIKREQSAGRVVAMTGDGTNDAPALAQADMGVAMNTGTAAAKDAGNMVDLDSNPTKLIEIVAIGKQLAMTRGALTMFSMATDAAKYFVIVPAMFAATYPVLGRFNFMGLHSPESAVLAAVIFNALVIIALAPLALRGVKYRAVSAAAMLRKNVLIYGLGGLIVPFPAIWILDRLLGLLRLA